jgi:PhnB protein
MKIQSYLMFNGRTEEALRFYEKTLGAKIEMLMRFKESPDQSMISPGIGDKVMHSAFRIGDTVLMATDGDCGAKTSFSGISLVYNATDDADARRRFDALADGGQVQVPLCDTFFASSFGVAADRFGVTWMVMAGPKNP